MIQMPKRSVTRFFIPLIDVLILLFCIFLLMEFNSETKADKQGEELSEQSETLQFLEEERVSLAEERNALAERLQKIEELNPKAVDLVKLSEENDKLREAAEKTMQRAFVRVIDIDAKDGTISFFDHKRETDAVLKITSKEIAKQLIDRHKEEAKGRQVYYYFMYPRVRSIRPLAGQVLDYQEWFKSAANSLVKDS